MKKIKLCFVALCFLAGVTACGNSGDAKQSDKDTTGDRTLPPPADNSSATNPSLADTAYHTKDTMKTHGDSLRTHK